MIMGAEASRQPNAEDCCKLRSLAFLQSQCFHDELCDVIWVGGSMGAFLSPCFNAPVASESDFRCVKKKKSSGGEQPRPFLLAPQCSMERRFAARFHGRC